MPNPVPKGPAAKNQKKADAIAGAVLKEVFQPDLGRGQFTEAHKLTLITSINCKLVEEGFEGNYTVKRLDAWLSNTLYRYRMAQKKRKPPSWQPKREKGAMALLDLTVTTDESPTPAKKRPRYPSAQDIARTDSAVAKAAAAAKASAIAAAAARAEFAAASKARADAAKAQADTVAKAAAAAKLQASVEAAAAAMNAPGVTSPMALVAAASATDSVAAFSPRSSPAAASAAPRNVGGLGGLGGLGALVEHVLSPTPGLVTIMGRRLNSPVSDPESSAGTIAMPRLVRRENLPLNDSELSEQAKYEDMVFSPLQSEASSPPSADGRIRVLKRTTTQEERELDPSSTLSSSMPVRSAFNLGGHLRRQDMDPYVLCQFKQEGAEAATEVI